MVYKGVKIAGYPHWRHRVALGLRGLDFDVVFLGTQVNNSFGGVFKCHCAASFADCKSLWSYALGIEKRFADMMMGENACRVFRGEHIQDLDELSRFLVVVLACSEECRNWFGNDKVRLDVVTDLTDFSNEGYVWTVPVYQCSAKATELVDNPHTLSRYVAALCSNLLERGETVLGMEIEDALEALRRVTAPKRHAREHGGEHIQRQSSLAPFRGADHESETASLEPRVKQVFTGFRWRWGGGKVVDSEQNEASRA